MRYRISPRSLSGNGWRIQNRRPGKPELCDFFKIQTIFSHVLTGAVCRRRVTFAVRPRALNPGSDGAACHSPPPSPGQRPCLSRPAVASVGSPSACPPRAASTGFEGRGWRLGDGGGRRAAKSRAVSAVHVLCRRGVRARFSSVLSPVGVEPPALSSPPWRHGSSSSSSDAPPPSQSRVEQHKSERTPRAQRLFWRDVVYGIVSKIVGVTALFCLFAGAAGVRFRWCYIVQNCFVPVDSSSAPPRCLPEIERPRVYRRVRRNPRFGAVLRKNESRRGARGTLE